MLQREKSERGRDRGKMGETYKESKKDGEGRSGKRDAKTSKASLTADETARERETAAFFRHTQ